ncbi:hypothetical protein HanOQP8_Chr12g0455821 [Helianthus annuus]|nr:hypothetical protein HanIR_Chr12g0597561 [Helianthus annuus]KAJ0679126.1 hypothetical protein HanOQP8_Chr12g0455821 [Helianthus annuus]
MKMCKKILGYLIIVNQNYPSSPLPLLVRCRIFVGSRLDPFLTLTLTLGSLLYK